MTMIDSKLEFVEDGSVRVDWSTSVTGIELVKQKLINNLLTDIGTDEIVPARGTSLLRDVTGGGVYDIRSAQHALNFAALAAKLNVRAYEVPEAADSDKVADLTILYSGVADRRMLTRLIITTRDSAKIETPQPII